MTKTGLVWHKAVLVIALICTAHNYKFITGPTLKMSSGPYGRHGFNANPSGYGANAGSFANPPAPSYGGAPPGAGYGYGNAPYGAAPGSGGVPPMDMMVRFCSCFDEQS